MYTIAYFENILKKKMYFTMHDIAKMKPSFIHPYLISGRIKREYYIKHFDKINQIRKHIMPHAKPFT